MTGGVSVLGGALRPRREGAWGSVHPSFRVCTVSSVSCPVSRMPCAHRVLPLHQRRLCPRAVSEDTWQGTSLCWPLCGGPGAISECADL